MCVCFIFFYSCWGSPLRVRHHIHHHLWRHLNAEHRRAHAALVLAEDGEELVRRGPFPEVPQAIVQALGPWVEWVAQHPFV